MKKTIALLLVLALAMSLAACGAEENPSEDLVITRAPEDNTADAVVKVDTEDGGEAEVTVPVDADVVSGPYTFVAEGVKLIPGEAFDASRLSQPQSTVEIPSCAFQGTDNVYNYGTFEVTAYNEGQGEFIFSVLFIDPNLTTPEGLALGDKVEKMEELYGTGYELTGENYVYTSGKTQLSIIAQNGTINYIEYRLAV